MSRCLVDTALIRQLRFCMDFARNMISQAEFLVDQFGYRTALARLGLDGRVDYTDRNRIEKWFQTLKMRVDRFHDSWVGSRSSARELLEQFVHYYTHQRPHQSLNGRTPADEVLNETVPP
jgi:putative transposase